MSPTTVNGKLPFPALGDTADVPRDMQALAEQTATRFIIGEVQAMARRTVPPGWLVCDGKPYDTTLYALLFAELQYDYGGAGASFNVPDLRGRAPIGTGTGAVGVSARAPGEAVGREKTLLVAADVPSHLHADGTLAMAAHTHADGSLAAASAGAHVHDVLPIGWNYPMHDSDYSSVQVAFGSGPYTFGLRFSTAVSYGSGTASAGAHVHDVSGATGGASTLDVTGQTGTPTVPQNTAGHENMQPSLAIPYFIFSGVYP